VALFLQNGGYEFYLINFHTAVRSTNKDIEASDTRFGTLYLPETTRAVGSLTDNTDFITALLATKDDPIIPVIAFEKLPAAHEANLFATIKRSETGSKRYRRA
jgi:hypothetical protein